MRIAALTICLFVAPTIAFVPSSLPQTRTMSTQQLPPLFMNQRLEDQLREKIAQRNSQIVNEEQYGILDGSLPLESSSSTPSSSSSPATTTTTTTSSNTNQTVQRQLDRLCQPRAYPLFLLEKGLEIMEGLWKDVHSTLVDAGILLGDDNDEYTLMNGQPKQKERIVILGTGWGGVSFLKDIDTDQYDVTVISPRNHFVFTPMLAGASVGTVEYRSICEPIRDVNRHANFLEATAQSIDPVSQTIQCESVKCEGNSCTIETFTMPYDKVIVTVGAQTNTFGIPGVRERCNFLKSVEDSRRIKGAIVNCFERANLPSLTDAERVAILTFAVIGAGPTGIEFAAELRDFIEQDGPKYYPNLLKYVRIKVIEASPTVLAPFDKSLQQEAIKQLQRTVSIRDPAILDLLPERFELTELLLESSVQKVGQDTIFLSNNREIPYGLAVWAAGNGPIALTLQVIECMGVEQAAVQDVARGRLAVDPWMRVLGGEGKVYAFGDCSCVPSSQLPATAQVASQQGEYLAKMMNKNYDMNPPRTEEGILLPPSKIPGQTRTSPSDAVAEFATASGDFAKPFQFLNLGILAYTGGSTALAQVTPAPNAPAVKSSGKIGNAVWRSVYLSKQVSWRNRLLVLNDWTNRKIFGRDITRV